jgi:DNA-binding NtrC family response regulator
MIGKKAILIVDDELIILESLRIQLSRILDEDIIVEAASSGEESIEIIDYFYNNGFDLQVIMSDYNLEDVKGTEILTYAHEKFPLSKKIILTGQFDQKNIVDFEKKIGLQGCLSKPWGFDLLKETVLKAYEDLKLL